MFKNNQLKPLKGSRAMMLVGGGKFALLLYGAHTVRDGLLIRIHGGGEMSLRFVFQLVGGRIYKQ